MNAVPLIPPPLPQKQAQKLTLSRTNLEIIALTMVFAAVLALAVVTIFFFASRSDATQYATSTNPSDSAPPQQAKTTPSPFTDSGPMELVDLAEFVNPSVVQVNTTTTEGGFTGSGFVLDKRGTIVTNYHVIEDATEAQVVFSDGTTSPIIGYLGVWPEKDIALIRVNCSSDKLHPIRLATSPLRQGEPVAAFGSPLGLQESLSHGIVSALRESKDLPYLSNINARLIQTNTPISNGNSGGPLVDMRGMVVGINTFKSKRGENVNFAVSVAELSPLLPVKNKTPSPLPPSDPSEDELDRILRRAERHFVNDDYNSAIADFTQAIRLNSGAYLYYKRGRAYEKIDDYDNAISDYTQAIQFDQESPILYGTRGWAYLSKEEWNSAIVDFTQSIRFDPQDAFVYYGRGEAYLSKKYYKNAIADLTQAIQLDPQDFYYSLRGKAYEANGQRTEALRDYTQANKMRDEKH
ncbi:trypsin-like peptidase domain-containing protein [Mariniblastus sp.]|nr:trypsin-like peptidase domain-containing protein [Mariniblastus sp.]